MAPWRATVRVRVRAASMMISVRGELRGVRSQAINSERTNEYISSPLISER